MPISREDIQNIATDVRKNLGLLRSCKRHEFRPIVRMKGKAISNHDLTCIHCGGQMRAHDVRTYLNGQCSITGEDADEQFNQLIVIAEGQA